MVRDANGNELQDGDAVTVIKDLKVKGSSSVVKVGTKVKSIRLVEGDHDIDCKIEGFGASTPRAIRVSIHETRMKEDVMSMQWLESGLTIPAGETVELKPNSYHLMLEKLAEPLKAGESIPLTLQFEGAEKMQIELKVQFLFRCFRVSWRFARRMQARGKRFRIVYMCYSLG